MALNPPSDDDKGRLSGFLAIDRFANNFMPQKSGYNATNEAAVRKEMLTDLFKQLDTNLDKEISYEEFYTHIVNQFKVYSLLESQSKTT